MITAAGLLIRPRGVQVAGVLDAVKGEIGKAFIALEPDPHPAEAELLAYRGGHLAAYKVPRASEFVDRLPNNAAAKILNRALRER